MVAVYQGHLHKRASLDLVRMEKLGAHSFWSDRMGVVGLLVADAGSGTFSRLAAGHPGIVWRGRERSMNIKLASSSTPLNTMFVQG